MKDHLIPHIIGKKTTKKMYDALGMLYQSVVVFRKMLLKNKINVTHMKNMDIVISYLMKIAELRDQIVIVGDIVEDNEIVQIYVNGFNQP